METRTKELAALEKNKKVTKEEAEEGQELLTRMPKLKARQELRKKYEALTDGKLPPDEFAAERAKIKGGMKLSADVAEKYTRDVLRAIETVRPEYVKEITIGEWGANAIKGLYRRVEQPLPDDIKDALKNPKTLARSKVAELIREAREKLGKREDLDDQKDVDTTILMMFAELHDPYTTYYDAATLKKMDAPLRGRFRGVGIQIRRDLVRDGLLVVSPIKGSPAYKAGIQAGDLITAIKRDSDPQGEPLKEGEKTEISTKGMKTEQALDLILGKVGVPITLVVEREGQKEPIEFKLERGIVSVETVLGVKRDKKDDWLWYVDEANKIGYVCLTQFGPSTGRELEAVINKMEKAGLNGLVLDLRFNPGGLLQTAVMVCDLFVDDGVVVSVRPRVGRPRVYHAKDSNNYPGPVVTAHTRFPIAVLVNGSSASAAEIVSACLQDYNRAVVVGERSYGKGSVQNVERFSPTGGEIKMTTARYFPPLGKNIDKHSTPGKPEDEWGVKPNPGFEIKLPREEQQELAESYRDREIIKPKDAPKTPVDKEKADKKPFVDRQLEKAVDYLRNQAKAVAAQPGRKDG
ncbi:S41 family peptidase [Fimbriiglobus ruber]|uniref:Carboxyl-terminal protease n=1 Tax=Fimbriiglobus ruber TaxID=1908690 RepID=A0A225DYZ7_9BACT|nr:S41 family peptidase [Fimbriiglobus ruber]OWK46750.1 Carboxyl-terminal protease [Fimbriiglobus ruber]